MPLPAPRYHACQTDLRPYGLETPRERLIALGSQKRDLLTTLSCYRPRKRCLGGPFDDSRPYSRFLGSLGAEACARTEMTTVQDVHCAQWHRWPHTGPGMHSTGYRHPLQKHAGGQITDLRRFPGPLFQGSVHEARSESGLSAPPG